jgi:23S rRNA pseudouridine2605 synthase
MYENTKNTMRLNKFISHNSKYSRREADKLIEEKKVFIDNKVVTNMATQVAKDDIVKIENKIIKNNDKKAPTVIVYNKQKGEIVSKNDPQGRDIIYGTLPKKFSHFLSIGRLDFTSEGVLLLTDDVNIANALMHSNLERIYKIKIAGAITDAMLNAMENGIILDNATAGAYEQSTITQMEFKPFIKWQIGKNGKKISTLKVAISEGKNRELRRFFAYFNAPVMDLKRVSFGGIELNNLPSGKVRYLDKKEYQNLRDFLSLHKKQNIS